MRLIDADNKHLQEAIGRMAFQTRQDVYDLIASQTTVDAVPVIYCKDCKHRTEFGNCGHPRQHGILPVAYPYDFCSYGERKDEAYES